MPDLQAIYPEPEGERLAITVCATDKYQYAMTAQARLVHANLRQLRIPIAVILAGDEGLKRIETLYRSLFKQGIDAGRVTVERIAGFEAAAGENYKNAAQLLIAQMRTVAFERARAWGASLCWSLDSDVLPKSSSCYSTLRWLLDMPGRYYEVAISPYPSQGGGDMLTGRGTPENPIAQDYLKTERKIPDELVKRIEANKAAGDAIKPPAMPAKELIDEANAINKAIGECPPLGNVFEMNAKNGWRRRGWLSAAYPALGRGAIVPSDWCGFGSTLMSRRALDEADFVGYDGGGTEDLYVVWCRWHQVGIRIGSALHEPSAHVSRRSDGKFFLSWPRFVMEADESKGECAGHLRTIQRPFYAQDRGEKYDQQNDGIPIAPADRSKQGPAIAPAPGVALADPATKAPADPGPAAGELLKAAGLPLNPPAGDSGSGSTTPAISPKEEPTVIVTRDRRGARLKK